MKNYLLQLFVCFFIVYPLKSSFSQVTFSEKVVAESLGGEEVIHVDIDEDGDEDLLIFPNLYLLINDGTGQFTTKKILSSGVVKSAQIKDVDSDGDWDIVATSNSDDEVYWLENDGNENFTKYLISTALTDGRNINAADFNGDGYTDIVVTGYNDNKILWWQNDGNQQFTESTLDLGILRPSTIAIADMDNDNDLDVVTFSFSSGAIYWYRNTSSGFSSRINIPTTIPDISDLYVTDVNGDNRNDVVAIGLNTPNIHLLINVGSFSEKVVQDQNQSGDGEDIFAMDMDKDGDIDILAGFDVNQHAWYENDGAENFTKHVLDLGIVGNGITATDLDNDMEVDLVYTDGFNIKWFKNDGAENFTTKPVFDNFYFFANKFFIIDYDGDGDEDWFTSNPVSLGWWENDGQQNFSYHELEDFFHELIYVGFVNNDNHLDIVSRQGYGNELNLLENDGNGNFSPKSIPATNNGWNNANYGDFDQDGDIDFVGIRSSDELRWFENDGNGNFTTRFISNSANHSSGFEGIDIGDLNNDEYLDFVMADYGNFPPGPQAIKAFKSSGTTFSSSTIGTLPVRTNPNDVTMVDLDNDGDMDIAAILYTTDELVWYENDGSLNFTAKTIYTNLGLSISSEIDFTDIDGDVDVDVIVGSSQGLNLLLNDGTENFTQLKLTANYCASELILHDVNQDGKKDILTGECGDIPSLVYWENTTIFPPPTNDACATAINLPFDGTAQSSNVSATTSMPPIGTTCYPAASNYGQDLWFEFTPTNPMKLEIGVQHSDFSELRFVLFQGTCGSFSEADILSCGSIATTNGTKTAFYTGMFEMNTTYFIQVWDDQNNELGEVSLYTKEKCAHPDFAPLKAFYAATNGGSWTDNRNWDTTEVKTCNPCNWSGISCKYVNGTERVYKIELNESGLSGFLPPEIAALSELEILHLYENNITGSIPPEIGNLPKLEEVWLSYNNLTGSIPPEIGNLSQLEHLWLPNNNLTGSIPPSIGNLSQITQLLLNNNILTGSIPKEIGDLNNSFPYIDLSNNNLSGCLDGNLKKLCEVASIILSSNPNLETPSFTDFCQNNTGLCGNGGSAECPTNLMLIQNPTKDTLYQAIEQITTNIVINNPLNVEMVAGMQILLSNGFQVNIGATFLAQIIDNCGNNLISDVERTNLNQVINNPKTPNDHFAKIIDLEVFPNPVNINTFVNFTLNTSNTIQLTLYNLNGQKISTLQPKTNYTAGKHQLEITADNLPVGIYFLTLQTSSERLTKKVLIQ